MRHASDGGGVERKTRVWRTSKVEKEEGGVKGVLDRARVAEENGCQRMLKVGFCL